MTAAALTAITDLLLAAEALFLAGRLTAEPKARFSAAWFWSTAMLLMGVAALIGAIDHGFIAPAGLDRFWIERPNWIVLAAMTFCVLMTTAAQFFSLRTQRILLVLGVLQYVIASVIALRVDSFLDVILNYAPIMVLLLVMNMLRFRKGTGSRWMIAGILIMFGAAAIQAAGVDTFRPLDHNGLYHVVSMAGVVFLYRAGANLKRE